MEGIDPSQQSVPGRRQRRPGSRLIRIGVGLLVSAVVGGVVLTLLAFLPVVRFDPDRFETMTSFVAEAGPYAVYTVNSSRIPDRCEVTGPDLSELVVRPALGSTTITQGDTVYWVAWRFEARDGPHQVRCTDVSGPLAVGPAVGVGRSVLLGFAGIGGGILLGMVGITCLIIGLVQRSSPPRPPPGWPGAGPVAGAPPQGWPSQPAQPGWSPNPPTGTPQQGWGEPPPGWDQPPR